MSAPAIPLLICGDEQGRHEPGCALGRAEEIARTAAAAASTSGPNRRNGLAAALDALAFAGLLRDLADDDPEDLVEGILDMLWEAGLIRRDGP